jgi:predicted amidohydrolase YtcJ
MGSRPSGARTGHTDYGGALCYTPRMRGSLFAVVALMAASTLCSAQSSQGAHTTPASSPKPAAPELIYFNGTIYTGNGLTADKPETVQAIAVSGGKVLAVGTTRQITRLAGPKTRLVDMSGGNTRGYIFPGFNDAHTHLGSAGRTKTTLDLTGVKSLAEMLKKTQGYAAGLPAGHWITGGNWDHTLWAAKVLPTREDLDKVTGGHPAFLGRVDGHIALANTAALKAAGITGGTKPPQGGAIDLDAHGEPTGIVRESAQRVVEKVIPPPSAAERRMANELAIADAVAHGVTSVQDFSDWEDFLVFEQLEKEGKLDVRISEWLPFRTPLEDLKRMRSHHDANDPILHTGMLKGFMDGSLGSRTAAMKAPFADDQKNSGLPQFKQDELNKMAQERAQAGFQLGFHAIGDKATAMALEAFSQPGISTKARNRVEHAQVVDPEDIPRFAKLGVIASIQPNHLLTDMNWAEERLGAERAAYSYAWKAFLDAGVPLAFGTDYPVEPITPFRGLYAAVTRMNEAGAKTYFPANKITRGKALYAYTQGSAFAEFAEKRKGKLAPGYEADFVVVDRDLFKVDAPALLETKVIATYVGGREVFPAHSSGR